MEYEDSRTIATPEGVQLALPLAGIGSRFMAGLLDYTICGTVLLIAMLAAVALGDDLAATIVAVTAVLAINVVYFTVFEVLGGGRTLGKKAIGIRVYDFREGGSIGYGRGLLRQFGKWLSAIPLGLGYFWMLWDKEKQCWQDKIASDVVVPTDAYR